MSLRERIFQLKYALAKPGAGKAYGGIETNQYLSRDEIEELNWRKAVEIFKYAFENSPYYRKKYTLSGIVPEDLRDPSDWIKIPAITKEEIRENFDTIRVPGCDGRIGIKVSTGGSTGVPLQVLHDARVPIEIAGWRMLSWWGRAPWEDRATVYRLPRTGMRKLIHSLAMWPTKNLFLDASMMSAASMRVFVDRYNKLKPTVLQGYVGAVVELARYLSSTGVEISSPKSIWVTSAPLTESHRHFIQEIFKAPVYDQYGSCEVFWIAAECREQNGLHVFADLRRVEFIREDGSCSDTGEYGDALVTDLENRVFPMVRYRIGDRGTWRAGTCSCGVSLPLMEKVKGRVSDCLRLPGGRVMAGEYVTTIFDSTPHAVSDFQVFQDADGNVTLKCVLGNSSDALSCVHSTMKVLQGKLGISTSLKLEIVESIPHDKGKPKFVISECVAK